MGIRNNSLGFSPKRCCGRVFLGIFQKAIALGFSPGGCCGSGFLGIFQKTIALGFSPGVSGSIVSGFSPITRAVDLAGRNGAKAHIFPSLFFPLAKARGN